MIATIAASLNEGPSLANSESPTANSSLEVFLERIAPYLKSLSRRMAGRDRYLQEELYQEGHIEAWHAFERYKPGATTVATYAKKCAHNRMLSVRRYELSRRAIQIESPDEDPNDVSLNEPADLEAPTRLVNDIDGRSLRGFMGTTLTPREFAAVDAVYFSNLPAKDAASRMRISAPRVTQLLAAAITKLGAALSPCGLAREATIQFALVTDHRAAA